MTVCLVLTAGRLDTFRRWLPLLVQQAININARNIELTPDQPVLFMLDEMSALAARGVSGHRPEVGYDGRRRSNCARSGHDWLPCGNSYEPVVGSAHERGKRCDNGRQAVL